MHEQTHGSTLVDSPPDSLTDPLTNLIARQTVILSRSRWHRTIAGLPHELAWRIHQRLEQLQAERPLTGIALRSRCGGVKTTIVHAITGNRKWGRSRLAARGHKTRKRNLYNPYKQALEKRYHTSAGSDTQPDE